VGIVTETALYRHRAQCAHPESPYPTSTVSARLCPDFAMMLFPPHKIFLRGIDRNSKGLQNDVWINLGGYAFFAGDCSGLEPFLAEDSGGLRRSLAAKKRM